MRPQPGFAMSSLVIPIVLGAGAGAATYSQSLEEMDTRISAHSITLEQFAQVLGRTLTVAADSSIVRGPLPKDLLEMLHGISAIDATLKTELVHERDVVDGHAAVPSFRNPLPAVRQDATWAAHRKLDTIAGVPHLPSESTDAVVVGCGLGGLIAAIALDEANAELQMFDKSAHVGGVWRHTGNPHSRVNSSEPGYRLRVTRKTPSTNHEYAPTSFLVTSLCCC